MFAFKLKTVQEKHPRRKLVGDEVLELQGGAWVVIGKSIKTSQQTVEQFKLRETGEDNLEVMEG